MTFKYDEGLMPFGTAQQQQYLTAYLECGGQIRPAAKMLGCHRSSLQEGLKRLREKAQLQGFAPEKGINFPVPDLFMIERMTLHTDANGNIKEAWPKLKLDDARWMQFAQERREKFYDDNPIPAFPEVPTPAWDFNPWVIPWYNIGDAHLNMLAQLKNCTTPFDLTKATRDLRQAFDILISETVPSERCVINDLGDFTHAENTAGVTSASGNILDMDQPYSTMVEVSTDLMEWIIVRALQRHEHVDVIINQGNHSRVNDLWMAIHLRRVFRDNPRVNVLDNSRVFIPYRMDDTLVMLHHSDKCPVSRLRDVFYTDFRQDVAETQFHYIWIGHIHHKMRTKEYSVEVESFNNLAPNDKYHHDAGYRSKNSITRVDLHRRFGEVGRRVLSINEIHAALGIDTELLAVEVTRV
jgi:hypothetical protein